MTPAISFRAASKRYGSLLALEALDLEVAAGRIFALVGPNGAGKTTAIGVMTGILAPTSGTVLVCGHDVGRDPIGAKRRVGFVPDRPYLWPKWTPRETLRFVGAVFGRRGQALEDRIEAELASFSLLGKQDERNETLSHGTRQRVALAQALLHDPDVLVLDEPMVGLDPHAQRHLVDRLRDRARSGGTVFLTTHQLSLAEDMADEVGLLSAGRLAALGSPNDLAAGAARGALSEVFFELTRADRPPSRYEAP